MEQQLEQLTNHGMIDLMHHQWTRYRHMNQFDTYLDVWRRWIRL